MGPDRSHQRHMTHRTQAIESFLDDIASETVSPAGGTGAAVTGAIGAALCEMAVIHTTNAESEAVPEPLEKVRDAIGGSRRRLLDLAEKDARAIEELYANPEDGSRQRSVRRATTIPLAVAETCLNVLEETSNASEHFKPVVAQDGYVGAMITHAALQSALHIVEYNLGELDDPAFREEITERVATITTAAERSYERILDSYE
ncbi:MAG: cyclodeaminase/cyclohydrolase family protein [Halodesulfurarchaeum sp.]